MSSQTSQLPQASSASTQTWENPSTISELPRNQQCAVVNLLSIFDALDSMHETISILHFNASNLDQAIRELIMCLGHNDPTFQQRFAKDILVAQKLLYTRLQELAQRSQHLDSPEEAPPIPQQRRTHSSDGIGHLSKRAKLG